MLNGIDSQEALRKSLDSRNLGVAKDVAAEFGFDIDSENFYKPRLWLGEQTGFWSTPSYLVRSGAIRAIGEKMDLETRTASLGADPIVRSGEKAALQAITITDGWSPKILSDKLAKKNRGVPYNLLPYKEIAEKMNHLLVTLKSIQEAKSPADIQKITSGLPGIAPGKNCHIDMDDLLASIEKLNEAPQDYIDTLDLMDAKRPQAGKSISWSEYWDSVNREIFQEDIISVDSLFQDFILRINNFQKYIEANLKYFQNRISDGGISLFNILDQDPSNPHSKKMRQVVGTFDGDMFIKNPKDLQESKRISGSEIQEMAERNQTGGPTAIMEYIFFYMDSTYLVPDPDEYMTVGWEHDISKFVRSKLKNNEPLIKIPKMTVDDSNDYYSIIGRNKKREAEWSTRVAEGFMAS